MTDPFKEREKVYAGQYFVCKTCKQKFAMDNPFFANNVLRCMLEGHKVVFERQKIER